MQRLLAPFFLWSAVILSAAEPASPKATPGMTIIEHPTPEQLETGFKKWSRDYPGLFTFEDRGTTPGGRPILMGRITDKSIPDTDKQVALLTSCHVAKELSAGTGLLRFMKWLLSNDAEAAEIRRRQIVLIVPYTDPDVIASGKLIRLREIYAGIWSLKGVTEPEKHPEAVALQGIMDEYRPELYVDYHGLNYAGRTMWDSTGISWTSAVSRPFLHDVQRVIDEAAEKEGFLITKGEQDDGKILTTSTVPGYPDHLFYLRSPVTNITIYPYSRYHTLAFIMETGSEESLIARTKRALLIGHERGRYDGHEAYPINQVGIWTLVSVSAYGTNATERRASRIELWQKLPQLFYGTAGPLPARDTLMAYVTTTSAARDQIRGKKMPQILERLSKDPRFDIQGLTAAATRFPFTGFGGPRPKYKPSTTAKGAKEDPIRHGVVMRLLIPYNNAEVSNVRLDGHLIRESSTDGYVIRHGPGTIVEFAVPPAKAKELHIVSCDYHTPTVRRAGFSPEDW